MRRSLLFFAFALAGATTTSCGSETGTEPDGDVAQTSTPPLGAVEIRPPAPIPIDSDRLAPAGDIRAGRQEGPIDIRQLSLPAAYARDVCSSTPRFCAEVENAGSRGAP